VDVDPRLVAGQDPTLDSRANALVTAMNRTGVQSIKDPRFVGIFYGASTLVGFALVPSSAGAVYGGLSEGLVSFETMFPGATVDIVNVLTPPAYLPQTWPGLVVGLGADAY